MPLFVIKVRVTLEGAEMLVEADSEEHALEKAKAHDWDDIEYDGASVADYKITGQPVEN